MASGLGFGFRPQGVFGWSFGCFFGFRAWGLRFGFRFKDLGFKLGVKDSSQELDIPVVQDDSSCCVRGPSLFRPGCTFHTWVPARVRQGIPKRVSSCEG